MSTHIMKHGRKIHIVFRHKKEGESVKIKIAYQDGEALQARTVEEWVRALWPQVKVRKSDRYTPFLHTYLTVDLPKKPRKTLD